MESNKPHGFQIAWWMVCSGSLRADRRAEKLDIMTKIQQCQEKLGEKKVEIKTSLKLKPPLPRGGVQSASSQVPRRPVSPKSQSPKSWRGLDPLPKGSVSDALLGIERLLAREKQIMAEFNAALANSVQQEALVRIFKKKIKRKKVRPSLPLTNETPASQNIESLRPGGRGCSRSMGSQLWRSAQALVVTPPWVPGRRLQSTMTTMTAPETATTRAATTATRRMRRRRSARRAATPRPTRRWWSCGRSGWVGVSLWVSRNIPGWVYGLEWYSVVCLLFAESSPTHLYSGFIFRK